MKKLTNCFRNLRMKQQILIVELFIMSVILAVIIGLYFIQQTILFNFIQGSTESIAMKQERRQLELASLQISNFLEQKYYRCNQLVQQRAILNIFHIEQFFQYYLGNKNRYYNVSSELFQPCVKEENKEIEKIIYNSNLFCYLSYDQTSIFNQSASLISEFSFLFDAASDAQLIIGNLPDPSNIVSYPQMFQRADFNIKTRPWFIAYQEMYENDPDEQYYQIPVYLSMFYKAQVRGVLATIYDLDGSPFGFAGDTILLKDKQLAQIPINILLVNNDGGVVFSSFLDDQEITYFQNQSITGFNETDWEYIQYYANNDNSDQLCNGHPNTFCLFNKLYNATVQIDAHQFKKEQFNLIIFANVTFEAELAQEFDNLTNNLLEQIVQIEWVLIMVCFTILILTGILIHFIFIPLFQLMENVKQHIRQMGNNLNKEIFKMLSKRKKPSNVFSNLNARFMNLHELLNKNQNHKSKLCLEIEQMQYNIKLPDIDYCNIQHYVKVLDGQQVRNDLHLFSYKRRLNREVNVCALKLINNTLQDQYRNNHQNN